MFILVKFILAKFILVKFILANKLIDAMKKQPYSLSIESSNNSKVLCHKSF